MKKNKMMRLASILLVCVLLSTSVISGTFAKYTTTASAGDTARVAKWGVNFDIEGGPLFSTKYATHDSTNYTAMTYSVNSSNTDNVVAPGTEGNLVTFRITGVPEVSYKVTYELDSNSKTVFLAQNVGYLENGMPNNVWSNIATKYEPVAFTYTLGKNDAKTANLETMIADINAFQVYFDVTDGKYYQRSGDGDWAVTTNTNITIDWAWSFDGGNDSYDTTLGNIAAGVLNVSSLNKDVDYSTNIDLTLSATATQIDESFLHD